MSTSMEINQVFSISNSKIKTFLRCPKKYEYRYVQGLFPKRKELPLERGTWIHSLLEAHYNGENWEAVHAELTSKFLRLFDEEREHLGDLPGETKRIMKSYLRHWDDSKWKIIAVEVEFAARLKKSRLIIKGKIDLVIQDELGVWCVEHKTNQKVPRDPPDIPDPQTTLYAYALRSMGLEGAGTIHNHMRTTPPKQPRVLKRGGLSKRCDTDYHTYLKAIRREGLDPADYKDILRKLKNQDKKFFIRFRVPWKKTAVKSMTDDYVIISSQMRSLKRFPRHISKMCKSDCPFFVLCMTELHGGNSSVIKRKDFRREGNYG